MRVDPALEEVTGMFGETGLYQTTDVCCGKWSEGGDPSSAWPGASPGKALTEATLRWGLEGWAGVWRVR